MAFIDKAKADGKPFFVWLNPTRMHVVTHLSDKYEALRTPENGWSLQEAGMAQLDDVVGAVMQKVKDMGLDGNTIIVTLRSDQGCSHSVEASETGDFAMPCDPASPFWLECLTPDGSVVRLRYEA